MGKNMGPGEIAEEVVHLLERHDDYLMPIRQIWKDHFTKEINFAEFVNVLQNHERLYVLPSVAEDEFNQEEVRDLEELGMYLGPKVLLKDRVPTGNALFIEIAKQLRVIQDSLAQAYQHKPENNKEAEKKLKQALVRSKDLEKDLVKAFSKFNEKH